MSRLPAIYAPEVHRWTATLRAVGSDGREAATLYPPLVLSHECHGARARAARGEIGDWRREILLDSGQWTLETVDPKWTRPPPPLFESRRLGLHSFGYSHVSCCRSLTNCQSRNVSKAHLTVKEDQRSTRPRPHLKYFCGISLEAVAGIGNWEAF